LSHAFDSESSVQSESSRGAANPQITHSEEYSEVYDHIIDENSGDEDETTEQWGKSESFESTGDDFAPGYNPSQSVAGLSGQEWSFRRSETSKAPDKDDLPNDEEVVVVMRKSKDADDVKGDEEEDYGEDFEESIEDDISFGDNVRMVHRYRIHSSLIVTV
jgi:hypothetical protein